MIKLRLHKNMYENIWHVECRSDDCKILILFLFCFFFLFLFFFLLFLFCSVSLIYVYIHIILSQGLFHSHFFFFFYFSTYPLLASRPVRPHTSRLCKYLTFLYVYKYTYIYIIPLPRRRRRRRRRDCRGPLAHQTAPTNLSLAFVFQFQRDSSSPSFFQQFALK